VPLGLSRCRGVPQADWQAKPAEAVSRICRSPKWVIQRYRLHEAAERLDTAATDLSTLAHELGYADQAHFARDFKAAVGRPPASYLRS
jgi:AraC-like DNA-binding protein